MLDIALHASGMEVNKTGYCSSGTKIQVGEKVSEDINNIIYWKVISTIEEIRQEKGYGFEKH